MNRIREIAEQVRAAGIPDVLNRWLTMTPESLAAAEAAVARQVEDFRNRRVDTTMKQSKHSGPKEHQLRSLREQKTAPAAPAKAPGPKPAPVPEESTVDRKTSKKSKTNNSRKAVKGKTSKPAARSAAKSKPAARSAAKSKRSAAASTKTAEVAAMLCRSEGCTGADILKLTGWPSVSVPQQAKAAGLSLRKEKKPGEPTRYFGTAKAGSAAA